MWQRQDENPHLAHTVTILKPTIQFIQEHNIDDSFKKWCLGVTYVCDYTSRAVITCSIHVNYI